MRKTTGLYTEIFKIVEIWLSEGSWKKNFSPKRLTVLKISDMEPWNLFWKNWVCPTYLISCESHKWFTVPFRHFQRMTEYESKYDWTFMLLKDFREILLSFELMHFRNSFCSRIENNWSFKYKILRRAGPLGTNLIFCLPWDCWDFKFP